MLGHKPLRKQILLVTSKSKNVGPSRIEGLLIFLFRNNEPTKYGVFGIESSHVFSRLMLNAHLPTGSRQLALSPTAD